MPASYLIIGAGTFGASTALALKKLQPQVDVTLIDRTPFPCPMAAGHDLNKIVRADYTDLMYMKLALEALDIWRDDPLYSQHFHQTGMLYSYDRQTCEEIVDNYEKLFGKGNSLSLYMDPAEARVKFEGIFRDAGWEGVTQCLWSPGAGWADSAAALKSVIQAAIDLGVNYVEGTAQKLLLDEHGTCIGGKTQDGREFSADRTILSAGANTNLILVETAPERPEIHAGERLIAVGAAMCAFKVSDEQMAKFKDCPVNEVIGTHIRESIPPGEKQLLKVTHDAGMTHKVYLDSIGQDISIPPTREDQTTWTHDIPKVLKDELIAAQAALYGEWGGEVDPDSYRMCWDSFTLNQDWLISPHPKASNLFIVSGGSYHGFKFLPVVGKYVVDLLGGNLDEEMATRWAWDGPREGAMCPEFLPDRDLADLV